MIGELTAHLWQSTLFAVAAGLLTLAFRRNRAKVRFWLWLSASLKFFIPFTLLMSLGSRIEWAPVAQKIATRITTPAVSIAAEFVAEPFPVAFAPAAPTGTDWTLVTMIGLWTGGFLAIALIRLRLWLRIRAAVRASSPLNIPAAVGIRSAPGLLEPGVVGLLKPVLFLPEGIMDSLTASQLEAVLAHELCHVRRRDNLFASIHMVVEAIFWFHPLVWWIGARLVEERERACDEDVLSLGNQPRVYADAILNVCKLYVESPLVCVSGVTGSDIRRRIEAIMTNRRVQTLNRAKKFLLAAAGIAALAGPVAIGVVIGIGHVPAIHAQSPVTVPTLPQVAIPSLAQTVPAPPSSPAARDPQAAPSAPAVDPAAPADTAADPANPANHTVIPYRDRRLVAMLFDFTEMSADEQTRVRKTAVEFIHTQLKPADLVCIMVAGGGPLKIAQDFTDDPARLQSAIQSFSVRSEPSAVSGMDAKLENIATASKLLAGFPEKKAIMYFSSGITQSGMDNQAQLLAVINTAKQSNVAIYPIDARGMTANAPGGDLIPAPGNSAGGAAAASGGGRGPGRGASLPTGVSQEEYNQRVAYAQTKFGSANSAMGRAYIRYGAPDQIDDRSSTAQNPSQIWRYNYLEDFHSGAAFEFTGTGPILRGARVLYPPPDATFEGKADGAGQVASLAAALNRESQTLTQGQAAPAKVIEGLPGRHASMQIYSAAPGIGPAADVRFPTLSVPLDSLSGKVDVAAQIRTRVDPGAAGATINGSGRGNLQVDGVTGPMAASLRDSIQAAAGAYQAMFTLRPGSYIGSVLVWEHVTGRMFGETIAFDVK